MSYTKFGEFVRVLRIKHHEVMGDMAKVLGASLPFLSAVENGKKNVPTEWIEKIVAHYDLTDAEKRSLRLPWKNHGRNTKLFLSMLVSSKEERRCSSHGLLTKWTMKPPQKFLSFLVRKETTRTNGLSNQLQVYRETARLQLVHMGALKSLKSGSFFRKV